MNSEHQQEEHMRKKIDVLLVIDMQNDFINGVLDNPAAAAIVPEVVREIREWKGKVVATRDTHFEDTFKDSMEGKLLPIHCVYGTEGWKIQKDIQKALEDQCAKFINKHNFGYIAWPKAILDVDATDQDAVATLASNYDITIRMVGTCTDICEASAYAMLRAWFPNATIQVVANASAASFNNKNQAAALDIARSMLCDVV